MKQKKKKGINVETKNIVTIALFLIAAPVAPNTIANLFGFILSVAFTIAGVYGLVEMTKNGTFVFS